MKPVTDPEILKQLNGSNNNLTPVSDPEILNQLNGDAETGSSPSFKWSPLDIAKDVGVGAGNSIQNVLGFLSRNKIPRINLQEKIGPEKPGLIDALVQSGSQYLPFALAGGKSLIGQTAAGFASGISQPNGDLMTGLKDALINAGTHGVMAGADALRPSRLLRGNLSENELKDNLRVAGDTSTGIGDVIGSPFLKRQLENVLSKIPFSGANDKLQQAGQAVTEKGSSILSKLLGEHNPETINDTLSKSLTGAYESHQKRKSNLYNTANDIADKSDLKLELPNFSKKAKDYSAAIESTNMLKYEPDVAKIYSKLQNYKNPVQEVESTILSPEGKPLISSIKYPTLKEANILKGRLNDYAERANKSPDMEQRGLAQVFKSLAKGLKTDIQKSIESSGNKELANAYNKAEEDYAKNFSPFLDKDIYQFLGGGKDPDLLVQSFIKTSRASDRSNILSKLTKQLPESEKSLLGYSYLSRALDKSGNLNPGKLTTLIDALGKNQFKTLFENKSLRQDLLDYSKFYKMNTKGVNIMQNPATGQQNLDVIPALISQSAGGAVGGFPGALAALTVPGLASKPVVNWMTSPKARESLVEAMLKNNKHKLDPRYAQTLVQAIANQNSNQ